MGIRSTGDHLDTPDSSVSAVEIGGYLAASVFAGLAAAVTVVSVRVWTASHRLSPTSPNDGQRVALVFGCQAFPTGPGQELTARLEHALELRHQQQVGVIAVSGGEACGVDEVAIMRDYLLQRGVPAEEIIELRPGDNTRQTLFAAAQSPLATREFLGVSSRYHAHRIEAEAKRLSLHLQARYPADSPELHNPDVLWVRYLTEVVGSIGYSLPRSWESPLRALIGKYRHTATHGLIDTSRSVRIRWHRLSSSLRDR